MIKKIWRILTQILQDRNDLAEILKPFYHDLNCETINDKNYDSFLRTFSRFQLELLFKNQILSEKRFYSIFSYYRRKNFDYQDISSHQFQNDFEI